MPRLLDIRRRQSGVPEATNGATALNKRSSEPAAVHSSVKPPVHNPDTIKAPPPAERAVNGTVENGGNNSSKRRFSFFKYLPGRSKSKSITSPPLSSSVSSPVDMPAGNLGTSNASGPTQKSGEVLAEVKKKKVKRSRSFLGRLRRQSSAPVQNGNAADPHPSQPMNGAPSLTSTKHEAGSTDVQQRRPPPRLRVVPGVCGILNHGNTCYINSIVQCLSHTDPLARHFLLTETDALFPKLKKERRREITESFANFLKSLWRHSYRDKVSQMFKLVLGNYRIEYKSREQQDAQEFLLYLMNTLHDEMNSAPPVKGSSQSTLPWPSKGRRSSSTSDGGATDLAAVVAENTRRNQSFVYKLCAGFQQSTLTCPGCRAKFTSLEPYLCLSLPIPARQTRPVFFTHVDIQRLHTRHALIVNTADTVGHLRAQIGHRVGIAPSCLLITEILRDGFGRTFQDTEPVTVILSHTETSPPLSSDPDPLWDGLYAVELPPAVVDVDNLQPQGNHVSSNSAQMSSLRPSGGAQHGPGGSPYATSNGAFDHRGEDDVRGYLLNGHSGVPEEEDSGSDDPSYLRIVVTHVEDGEENGQRRWRRFTGPAVLQMHRQCSLDELKEEIVKQLVDTVEHVIQMYELRLRFWVVDGIKGQCELPENIEFPLINECVDRALNWNESGGGIRHLKLLVLWWQLDRSELLPHVVEYLEPSHLDPSVQQVIGQFPSGAGGQERQTSLEDCLQAYMTAEKLAKEDAWHCPKCRCPQQATVQSSLWSSPDLLIVHLKRFKSAAGGSGGTSSVRRVNNKLEVLVEFPLTGLDVAGYLVHQDHSSPPEDHLYDLVGVCNHYGSMAGGHYTAFCRSPVDAQWRCYNDDKVELIDPQQVVQHQAYILFYQRRSSMLVDADSGENHWSYYNLDFPPTAYADFNQRQSPPHSAPVRQEAPKSDPPRRKVLSNVSGNATSGISSSGTSTLPRSSRAPATQSSPPEDDLVRSIYTEPPYSNHAMPAGSSFESTSQTRPDNVSTRPTNVLRHQPNTDPSPPSYSQVMSASSGPSPTPLRQYPQATSNGRLSDVSNRPKAVRSQDMTSSNGVMSRTGHPYDNNHDVSYVPSARPVAVRSNNCSPVKPRETDAPSNSFVARKPPSAMTKTDEMVVHTKYKSTIHVPVMQRRNDSSSVGGDSCGGRYIWQGGVKVWSDGNSHPCR